MVKVEMKASKSESARERILKAAIIRFSYNSYEATGLRDIAADVGVDVAYVHRSFGSKEKLFFEALRTILKREKLVFDDLDELASNLAKEILIPRNDHEIRMLDIVIRSFSSPEAARVQNQLLMEEIVLPLTKQIEGLPERNAALVAAVLCGVGILRDVIRSTPLQEADDGELEEAIEGLIKHLLRRDVPAQAHGRRRQPAKSSQRQAEEASKD